MTVISTRQTKEVEEKNRKGEEELHPWCLGKVPSRRGNDYIIYPRTWSSAMGFQVAQSPYTLCVAHKHKAIKPIMAWKV